MTCESARQELRRAAGARARKRRARCGELQAGRRQGASVRVARAASWESEARRHEARRARADTRCTHTPHRGTKVGRTTPANRRAPPGAIAAAAQGGAAPRIPGERPPQRATATAPPWAEREARRSAGASATRQKGGGQKAARGTPEGRGTKQAGEARQGAFQPEPLSRQEYRARRQAGLPPSKAKGRGIRAGESKPGEPTETRAPAAPDLE